MQCQSELRWFVSRFLLLVTLAASLQATAAGSPDGVWFEPSTVQNATSDALRNSNLSPNVSPFGAAEFSLNAVVLSEILSRAPMERRDVDTNARAEASALYLPTPEGKFVLFNIVESPIMAPELAAAYPEIKTYAGYAVGDSATTVRLDVTPNGFHAQVLRPGHRWSIDPKYKGDLQAYVSYHKHQLRGENHQCLLEDSANAHRNSVAPTFAARSGDVLRTYRLAVATTSQYTAFHGGTVSSALAAVVTTINRVTGIYERDFAVRFVLVSNNDEIIFTAANDPFTGNDNANVLINQSQTQIDLKIGTANYDVGHTFSTGAGGLAGLGVVCSSGGKAQGVTGRSNPVGDPYDVDYVAHEIGHQFGGSHTFNSLQCASNRSASNAYEPGSGSTIQAYAGICGSDNLQANSDAMFHSQSLQQMNAYIDSQSCEMSSTLVNAIPTANAGQDYTIPVATPFMLTGSATDANNADTLTYSWEQRDLGPTSALGSADDGSIPLFRTYPPTASAIRYLPKLATLSANTPEDTEKLPSVPRTMKWRLTVRDNKGGVDSDDAELIVTAIAGPFIVTSPNGGENTSGSTTVTWNVANTSIAPVMAANVDIFLSTDGGMSFDMNNPLATNTPNDGSHAIVMPNLMSATARVMVKASGNVFFDVSDQDFSIAPGNEVTPPVAVASFVAPTDSVSDTTPTYTWGSVESATGYRLYVTDGTGNVLNQLYSATEAGCDNGGNCSITPATVLAAGAVKWWVQASNDAGNAPWSVLQNFTVGSAGPPVAVATFVAPTGAVSDTTPTYTWGSVASATGYRLYVSDVTGNVLNQLYSAAEAGCDNGGNCSITPTTVLTTGAVKWWVQASNSAGNAPWSALQNFTIGSVGPPVAVATFVTPTGTVSDATPTYTWVSVASATGYRLYVSDVSGNVLNQLYSAAEADCDNGGNCSITPSTVLATGAVKWWVQASNSAGNAPWSALQNFTVGNAGPPVAVATFVVPTGSVSDTTPTYTWGSVESATGYRLYVNDATGNVLNQLYSAAEAGCNNGGDCSITPATVLAAGAVKWWVRASNSAGNAPWSAQQNFTVSAGEVTAVPVASDPIETTWLFPGEFTWTLVEGATEYQLYVRYSDGEVFSPWYSTAATALTCTDIAGCYVGGFPFNKGGTYWIRARNSSGTSDWSTAQSFGPVETRANDQIITLRKR